MKNLFFLFVIMSNKFCFTQDKFINANNFSSSVRIDAGFINLNSLIFNARPRLDFSLLFEKKNFYFGIGLFEHKLRKLSSFEPLQSTDEFYGKKTFWLIYLETPFAYDFSKFLSLKKCDIHFEVCPQRIIAGKAIWMNIFDDTYPNTNTIRYKDNRNYYAFNTKFNLKTSVRYNYHLNEKLSLGAFVYFQWIKIAQEYFTDSWSVFSSVDKNIQKRDTRFGVTLLYKFLN